MSKLRKQFYAFGPFRLDIEERLLWKEGTEVHLEPRVFDILSLLVEKHPHLVRKDELIATGWPDLEVVSEHNLTRAIADLRKALGDSADQPEYIRTHTKLGYRFIAHVQVVDGRNEEEIVLSGERESLAKENNSSSLGLSEVQREMLKSIENGSRVLRSSDSIASQIGLGKDDVDKQLRLLRTGGLVEQKRENRGFRWYITEKGRKVLATDDIPD